jgi:hypothetical protein
VVIARLNPSITSRERIAFIFTMAGLLSVDPDIIFLRNGLWIVPHNGGSSMRIA